MLVTISGESHDITKKNTDVLEPSWFDGIRQFQLLRHIIGKNDLQQFVRAFLLFLDLAQVSDLTVAEPLALDSIVHGTNEQVSIHLALYQVILGAMPHGFDGD